MLVMYGMDQYFCRFMLFSLSHGSLVTFWKSSWVEMFGVFGDSVWCNDKIKKCVLGFGEAAPWTEDYWLLIFSVSCIVLVDIEVAGLISPSLTCPWAKHFIPKIRKHSAASRLHSYLQQRPRGRHNTHHSLSAKVAKATVQRRSPRLQCVPFLFSSPLSDLLVAQLHLGRRREWDKGHGNKRHTPFIHNLINIC